MIIVSSNSKVKIGKNDTYMTYNDFKEKAFGEGLDADDNIMIDVNDIEEEVYEACKDIAIISYFSLDGMMPDYVESDVEDWRDNIEDSSTQENETTEEEIEEDSYEEDEPEEPVNSESDAPKESKENSRMDSEIMNLLDDNEKEEEIDNKDARIIVFGSSKGGTGKTFTSLISTYRYAQTHPHKKIALVDFDIIDGQVGISIHKINPTMRNYFKEYQKGYKDFTTMHNFAVKGNSLYPQNVDFYLAPSNGQIIKNPGFWLNIIENCRKNYDVVIFDTGIDYLNIEPISWAYKMADKIILTTTTSINSVSSVSKQISKLKGEVKNGIYTPDDEIGPRINIVITQMDTSKEEISRRTNGRIVSFLKQKAPVIATFGVITTFIACAQYDGEWNIFDNNDAICKALDNIMS